MINLLFLHFKFMKDVIINEYKLCSFFILYFCYNLVFIFFISVFLHHSVKLKFMDDSCYRSKYKFFRIFFINDFFYFDFSLFLFTSVYSCILNIWDALYYYYLLVLLLFVRFTIFLFKETFLSLYFWFFCYFSVKLHFKWMKYSINK